MGGICLSALLFHPFSPFSPLLTDVVTWSALDKAYLSVFTVVLHLETTGGHVGSEAQSKHRRELDENT